MPNASSRKGARRERELVNKVDEHAFMKALRCPASGGATEEDRPDLLVLKYDRPTSQLVGRRVTRSWAIEAKADAEGTGRLKHAEVFGLCRYALQCGAEPLVAVHPNYGSWGFYRPRELTLADNSRGVTKDMLPGRSFTEVFEDGA